MLFDLRSRGRRRTVQVVYLGLALVLGGGLVLFGVGTGNGNGGLLNAFNGGGSSSAQGQALSAQEKAALKQTRLTPSDANAWAALVLARWDSAATGSNYDTANGSFTAGGKKELANAVADWQQYLKLTKSPSSTLAQLAARAYGALGQYSGEASAWEIQSAANPGVAHGYECLAASAYAAGQTREGDLALNKALPMVPKLSRTTVKSEIQAAKTSPTIAANC
jgi:hypothetical protein